MATDTNDVWKPLFLDPDTIFDWAEDNFPQFFPPPGTTTTYQDGILFG